MDLDNTTTLLIYSFLPLSSKLKFNTPDMGGNFFFLNPVFNAKPLITIHMYPLVPALHDRDCLTRGMGPCLVFEPSLGYLTKHHVVGKAYLPNTSGAM